MELRVFEHLESEVRSYIRAFPTVFHSATGATLYDENHREYIDFFSGAGTLNYGHNEPHLKDALLKYLQRDGIIHGLDMATTAKREFIERFDELILKPRAMDYKFQFPGPTGTNAVEAALKLARLVKRRTHIVSFTRGFHGVTSGSLAATANTRYREAAGTALDEVVFMPYEGFLGREFDTLAYFDRMLSDRGSGIDPIAGVIVETIQGEGGVNVASASWLRGIEALCRRHDLVFIVDEIQMGCGRTGSFFSFENAGISPDIITLSKSLSGFGLPLSLVLLKPELDLWAPGAHNGTSRGNNAAFVTASEALNRFWRTPEFSREVIAKGQRLRNRLDAIAEKFHDDGIRVRGRGMVQGLVPAQPEWAGKIAARAFDYGLIVETSGPDGEVLKLLPPLVIDDGLMKTGLDILEQCLREISAENAARIPSDAVPPLGESQ